MFFNYFTVVFVSMTIYLMLKICEGEFLALRYVFSLFAVPNRIYICFCISEILNNDISNHFFLQHN